MRVSRPNVDRASMPRADGHRPSRDTTVDSPTEAVAAFAMCHGRGVVASVASKASVPTSGCRGGWLTWLASGQAVSYQVLKMSQTC